MTCTRRVRHLFVLTGFTAATAVGLGGVTPHAYAADTRLVVFATLGIGGEAEGQLDLANAPDPDKNTQALDNTLGLGVSYDAEIVPYVSLGGLIRLYSWSADPFAWETNGDNQGTGFDLALLPRLRFHAGSLELYAATPFGLTLASKDDNTTFLIVDSQYDLGVGWDLGLFAGIQYPVTSNLALYGELGWLMRSIGQHGSAEANPDADADLNYRTGQLTFNLGVAFF